MISVRVEGDERRAVIMLHSRQRPFAPANVIGNGSSSHVPHQYQYTVALTIPHQRVLHEVLYDVLVTQP